MSSSQGESPHSRQPLQISNRADGGVLYWLAKLFAFAAISFVALLATTAVATYLYFANTLPSISEIRNYSAAAPRVTRVYAGDGTLLAELATEWREITPIAEIPERLQRAFIAAEDHRFREHGGIDFVGVMRAFWANISSGAIRQGGSTITQQVAKMYLGGEKTFSRKIREAALARRMEARLTKSQILEIYLNNVFLGGGAYGVAAAAARYFDKRLDELTIGETALIAGLARLPSRDAPTGSIEHATVRRNQVLRKMAQYGVITESERRIAESEPILLSRYKEVFGDTSPYFSEQVRRDLLREYGRKTLYEQGLTVETTVLPWVDSVAAENVDFATRKLDKRQGFRKSTRFGGPPEEEPGRVAHLEGDDRIQFKQRAGAHYDGRPIDEARNYLALVESVTASEATVSIGSKQFALPISQMRWAAPFSAKDATNDRTTGDVRNALEVGDVVWVKLARRSHIEKFKDWTYNLESDAIWVEPTEKATGPEGVVALEQTPRVQSSIFTFDLDTGYVIAMAGGTDFDRSKFNRATQACRQPGSTYKPIYYSLALDRGYSFDTSLQDVPKAEVDPITGEVWTPTDMETPTSATVSLEWALVWSRNIPSVEIFVKVGAKEVEAWARRLGFTTPIHADKALALGASCTTIDELSRAFSVFANNGQALPNDLVYVKRIRDRFGKTLVDRTVYFDPTLSTSDKFDRLAATALRKPKQVIPARTGYLTSKLLRQVVDRGHAKPIRQTELVAAGKTGTSSATMDVWFTGYTARWYTTFWMGDDMRERPLGYHDASFMLAVPSWARYMHEVAGDQPQREIPWETPSGIRTNDRGGGSHGGGAGENSISPAHPTGEPKKPPAP